MFDYVTSIRSWAHECTPALFAQIIDSSQVAGICAEIEDGREKCLRGEMSRDDFNTFKTEKKKRLPGFNFQAHYINGGRRLDKNAVASGLCIYDKDHVADPEGWYRKSIEPRLQELGIVLAHKTPSLEGIRLVFRIARGVSLAQAQSSLAQAIGDDEYDGSVKDMARISFAVPRSYILYLDEKGLFEATPETYQMPFAIAKPHRTKQAHNTVGTHPVKPWRCKRPTRRVMMIIGKAMQKRGITKAALEHKGQRHYMFVNLLSSGICRLLTKEELMGGLKQVTRIANTDNIWQLVADWYENYLNANRPVSQDFAWTFADVLNIDDEGTPLPVVGEGKEPEDVPDEDDAMLATSDAIPATPDAMPAFDFTMSVDNLPMGLRESLMGVPRNLAMPVLCSIMPLAGAYADRVEVRYADGKKQHLGLMSIIVGEQASKKSTCKDIVDIWKRPMHEDDMAQRKVEDEWKQRRKNRKANEKGEPDPQVLIREIPVTTSCSTLLKRFKNSRGHCLYSFGEELDTLRKTNGAGSWSSKYDIYRLSFDRGEWGQDYNSDQAESGMVKVAYNWTILGTYGALKKCFRVDNIENGLSSRMMIAEMPDNRFAPLTTFADTPREADENIQKAVGALRSASGFVDTPRLREAMASWVEEKRVEALQAIDEVKDTYRKRAAVIGFRCGVIFYLLEEGQADPSCHSESDSSIRPESDSSIRPESNSSDHSEFDSSVRPESDYCLSFARMMAEYVLKEQCKMFGGGLTDERLDTDKYEEDKNSNVLAHLPSQFTMNDLRAVKGSSYPDVTLRKTISRWRHDGWIEKIARGVWRKAQK